MIELMIAMGVFVLAVSAIAGLIIEAYLADRSGRERMLATFLAKEGIEAVRSIRDADFDNLTLGIHGLTLSGNNWIFSGSSDIRDKFTRQIIISGAAGEIDQTDIKKVESKVNWQIAPLRQVSVILTDYLTDWKQTQGRAGGLTINISNAALGGGQRQRLERITVQNTGSGSIVIDKITISWSNSRLIERIRINSTDVWLWNGAGTPDGRQPSGTELNINNLTLAQGSGVRNINQIGFNGSMSGTDFIIKFIMTDGSAKYVLVDL